MAKFLDLAVANLHDLVTIRPSDRPWHLPFAAALTAGIPLLTAAALDQMAFGAITALAALVFLYLPPTALPHRMVTMLACSFGMTACFTIGLVAHELPSFRIPILTFCTVIAMFAARYFRIVPPGGLFFVMGASIAAFAPGELADLPARAGIMAIGCINACLIAFFYSLFVLRRHPPQPAPVVADADLARVRFDSFIIGLFVALSLLVADLLQLEKPYWVPVSCMAIIQGVSLTAAWNRQVHRIVGTSIGLCMAWVLLSFIDNAWEIAIALTLLQFIIENAVVRHYAFAVMFITPLTILLAEAPTLGGVDPTVLIEARFVDTVLGALIGFIGAACLHSPAFRARAGRFLGGAG